LTSRAAALMRSLKAQAEAENENVTETLGAGLVPARLF
jgi:hypothetical protein